MKERNIYGIFQKIIRSLSLEQEPKKNTPLSTVLKSEKTAILPEKWDLAQSRILFQLEITF